MRGLRVYKYILYTALPSHIDNPTTPTVSPLAGHHPLRLFLYCSGKDYAKLLRVLQISLGVRGFLEGPLLLFWDGG